MFERDDPRMILSAPQWMFTASWERGFWSKFTKTHYASSYLGAR